MRVCVYGLWHLGVVTAACLAGRGISTIGLAETVKAAAALNSGSAPLFEPGLNELIQEGVQSGVLGFTHDPEAALPSSQLVWVTFDTPVDDEDQADVAYVLDRVRSVFHLLRDGAVVLISSQLPVGSTSTLERDFAAVANGRTVSFAYSPENLRLGGAIKAFTEPERIVVGIRNDEARRIIEPILELFCSKLLWMLVESAEMVKHSLNAYLATCVTFTNELACVCETVGADMYEVEKALRLDPRVGSKAYIRAGAAFGGGTLARDVQFLRGIASRNNVKIAVLDGVLESNAHHKGWVLRHLRAQLQSLAGRQVGMLGLAYKAGTDAIRRSVAIEIVQSLNAENVVVKAFDPKVKSLPSNLAVGASIAASAEEVFRGSDAIILATEWPEFKALDFRSWLLLMRGNVFIDQNSFVAEELSKFSDIRYLVAGRVQ